MGDRVSALLGLSADEAALLEGRARARLGRRAYAPRKLAFLAATLPLLSKLLPRSLRARAIRPLVHVMLPGPAENLVYAGVDEPEPAGDD